MQLDEDPALITVRRPLISTSRLCVTRRLIVKLLRFVRLLMLTLTDNEHLMYSTDVHSAAWRHAARCSLLSSARVDCYFQHLYCRVSTADDVKSNRWPHVWRDRFTIALRRCSRNASINAFYRAMHYIETRYACTLCYGNSVCLFIRHSNQTCQNSEMLAHI